MENNKRAPHVIRNETLSALRSALTMLKSTDVLRAVRNGSAEDESTWADTLLRCDAARDDLELAELTEIRDKLKQNDAGLQKGTEDLKATLKKFNNLKKSLDAIAGFLEIVGKIVGLVA